MLKIRPTSLKSKPVTQTTRCVIPLPCPPYPTYLPFLLHELTSPSPSFSSPFPLDSPHHRTSCSTTSCMFICTLKLILAHPRPGLRLMDLLRGQHPFPSAPSISPAKPSAPSIHLLVASTPSHFFLHKGPDGRIIALALPNGPSYSFTLVHSTLGDKFLMRRGCQHYVHLLDTTFPVFTMSI